MTSQYVPCPKCGSGDSQLAKFTWWGGAVGPRLLTHVKCQSCGNKFNGKNGGDNSVGIGIYLAISAVIGLFVGILAFIFILASF